MTAQQTTLFCVLESDIGQRPLQESVVPDVAVAVLHDRTTDKVLLIRRSRGSDFVGWVFPGGKIERLDSAPGKENPVDAARRELAEETGLCVGNAGKEIFCRRHPATGVVIRYVYFPVECSALRVNASSREPAKADDCAWVNLDKLSLMFRGGLSDGIVRGIKRELYAHSARKKRLPELGLEFGRSGS
jgi:8-oxo-dGTP pyrophosphatase MutT (NUDIX family)